MKIAPHKKSPVWLDFCNPGSCEEVAHYYICVVTQSFVD